MDGGWSRNQEWSIDEIRKEISSRRVGKENISELGAMRREFSNDRPSRMKISQRTEKFPLTSFSLDLFRITFQNTAYVPP